MGDYTVIVAALAGAVAGILLLRLASAWGGRPESNRAAPPAAPPMPTGYARRPAHTTAPILLAVGLALFGVGLAIGSGDGALDLRLLLPGMVVLLAALAAARRKDDRVGPPAGQAPADDVAAAEVEKRG